MKQDDFPKFQAAMNAMAKVFDREIDSALLDAYWGSLAEWSIEDFTAAASHLTSSSDYMPRPAQFNALRASSLPTAAEAWARVLTHCKGAYRDGSGIDDGGPIDTAVSGLGGYRAIAFYNIDYLGALQRQFVDRFAEQADVTGSRLLALAGPDQHPRLT